MIWGLEWWVGGRARGDISIYLSIYNYIFRVLGAVSGAVSGGCFVNCCYLYLWSWSRLGSWSWP